MSTPTPIARFHEWLTTYAATTGYTISRGEWQEIADNSAKKFIAIQLMGGRAPVFDSRYPQIRVVVTGRRDQRGDAPSVEQFAHDTITAAIEHFSTNCLADVQALSEPQGPFFTDANRACYELNFQLII